MHGAAEEEDDLGAHQQHGRHVAPELVDPLRARGHVQVPDRQDIESPADDDGERLLGELGRHRAPEVGPEALDVEPPHLDAVRDPLALEERLRVGPVLAGGVVQDSGGHEGHLDINHSTGKVNRIWLGTPAFCSK